MTAPTPAPARCEDCGRPFAVDDAHRCPEDRAGYCWKLRSRSEGEMAVDAVDCYARAYERTSERERRLVEAHREYTEANRAFDERPMDVAAWTRLQQATQRRSELLDALLADTDGGTT